MAAVTCKYHTQTPARWRCSSCQINFCPNCVKQISANAPDCPVCRRELESVGSANLIKPFWSRLRQFFLYPLHPAPLITMLVLASVTFLLKQMPGWGIGYDFLFWRVPRNFMFALPFAFVFLKYAQSVLEDTARGHLKPMPLSPERLTENALIVIKLFAILVVFKFIEFAALDLFNQIGKQIISLVLSFATPAAIMVLAMEDKLVNALNPSVVFSVITRIGAPYFLLFAMFYFLQLAHDQSFYLIAGVIDPSLWLTIYVFLSMYFYLIAFNMMGYLLYQHHEALGYSIDVEVEDIPEVRKKSQEPEVSPELRATEILIHEGKTEEAISQLLGIIRNAPTDIEARERLLKLTRLVGNTEVHAEQADNYIAYLLSENKLAQAAKVYLASIEFDNKFKPSKPGQRVELGNFLRQNGYARQAMGLLNNLHKDFPTYEKVPEAYLMVAQMLCEQFSEDKRARQVLNFILQNYPSSPAVASVQDYLRIVEDVSNH